MRFQPAAFIILLLPCISSMAPGQSVSTLLDLKVMNGTDQPRVNEPVSFGIPIGLQNQVYALDWFQIVDPNLQPIPRQFKVLTRWGGDRSDVTKPIRWALVSFNANVPASGTATYHVALGGSAPAPTSVWAADTLNYIEVHTGPNTYFRVGKTGFRLFEAAVVNGTSLVNPGRIDLVTATGALVVPVITETVLEEYAGYQTVRVVVRQRGNLGQLKFTCRWFFQAGRNDVTVDFRLENPNAYGLFSTSIPDGQQYFDSIYLVQPVLGSTFTLTTDSAVRTIAGSQTYDLQQTYETAWQTDPLDLWTGFGFTETVNGTQVGNGTRFKGALDFKGSAGGVTVTVDRFWQNFPKGLRAQSGELKIGLFPEWGNGPEYRGQYADPTSATPIDPMAISNYRFEGGRWKSHRMVFDFHTGVVSAASVSAQADRVNAPLIGSPPPSWIRYTAATGTLWMERKTTTDVGLNRWEKFTDMLGNDLAADPTPSGQIGFPGFIRRGGTYGGKQGYGWDNFGDIPWAEGYCSQHYDWTQPFMLGFWRTGDYRLFNYGRDVAVSRRDYNQNHSTNTAESWRGAQFYEKGWWHGNYSPGTASHNWLEGLLMYYVITGDESAREAAIQGTNYLFLNAPKNWSGWYGSRIPGWSIDNLMAAYSFLGSPVFLTEAGLGVYRYLTFEQACGGIGCVINPANGETQSWMENIFHIAACKYYLASGDAGVLPLLGRMRDWFKNDICVLPTGTYPNYTLTMVHEHWSVGAPGNLHVHHCWSMSESFAYSAAVFNSQEDLGWSKTYFDGPARYWQCGVSFSPFNCTNTATYSPVTFRPTQYPGTESKTLSNVLRWGAAQPAVQALLNGGW